jgi:Concanavalin A-like lectin/glucanases superfamily
MMGGQAIRAGAGGRRKGVFLTLDSVTAMLLLFVAVIIAFSYFSVQQGSGVSAQLMMGTAQDAASVMLKQGYLSAPLASPNNSDTSGIGQVLRSTPASMCMQVAAYGISNPNGLVGYWNFDEGQGGSTADTSGSGNAGVLHGGAAFVEDGKAGKSMSFNGNSYVSTAANYNWDYNHSFSISGWIKPYSFPPDSGSYRAILAKQHDPNDPTSQSDYELILRGDGEIWFDYNAGLDYGIVTYKSYALTVGQWTQFAVTYNATSHTATLYVDGMNETEYVSVSQEAWSSSSGPLVLGSGCSWCDEQYFQGELDDIRLYNRSLSASEVSAMYSNPSNLLYVVNKQDCDFAGGEMQTLRVPFTYNANQVQNNYYYATVNVWQRGAR